MKFAKKIISLGLVGIIGIGVLTGCQSNNTESNNSKTEATQTQDENKEETKPSNDVSLEKQSIGLEKVSNARQLGGYVTESGKKVVMDKLIRSGKLAEATDSDIQKLKDLNLSTVVDFRTTDEIGKEPDPEIEGVKNEQVKILNENVDNNTTKATTKVYDNPAESLLEMYRNGVLSDDMYSSVLNDETAQKGFAQFFQILLEQDADKAILWHCTGGKDRAGSASALLLSILGVDRETVLDDFELTNEFLADRISYMQGEAKKLTDKQDEIDGVGKLTGVDRSFMEKALAELDEKYGSPTEYVKQELGLSDEDIQTLQDKYLQ